MRSTTWTSKRRGGAGASRMSTRFCTCTSFETSPPETARKTPFASMPVSSDQPPPSCVVTSVRSRNWVGSRPHCLNCSVTFSSAFPLVTEPETTSGCVRPKIVGRTVMVIAAGATTRRAICSSAFSNIAAVGSLAKVTLASTL